MISRTLKTHSHRAFSLIELLTAMSILSVLMLLLTSLLTQVQNSWVNSQDRVSQFREARVAFDMISRNLSQATTNTYWDYKMDSENEPEAYEKRSDLHFKVVAPKSPSYSSLRSAVPGELNGHGVFFQAPLGYSLDYRNLGNLYNGRGYMVVFGSDQKFRPSFVKNEKFRFRLFEYRPPAEENYVFSDKQNWWTHDLEDHLNPVAENVVYMVIEPLKSISARGEDRSKANNDIAEDYFYDSNSHAQAKYGFQVPPLVRITMVAIDEGTAIKLEDEYNDSMPDIIPAGVFSDADSYEDDIETVTAELQDKRIGYRIFSTTVMLRAAKWSVEE